MKYSTDTDEAGIRSHDLEVCSVVLPTELWEYFINCIEYLLNDLFMCLYVLDSLHTRSPLITVTLAKVEFWAPSESVTVSLKNETDINKVLEYKLII